MKTKIKTLLTLALFSATNLFAQQNYVPCASHEYLKYLDSKAPGLEQYIKDLSLQSKDYKATRAGVITVPVVVHIVYKNATENLSDAYIQAQIDLLNKSYLRQNSDTTTLRSEFLSRVGKANVQFMLVQTVRKQTANANFMMTNGASNDADKVKYDNEGGSGAIDPAHKLNIWVCDLAIQGGELLGYAYPPAGLANWGGYGVQSGSTLDGVVIDYMAFGGTSKKPLGFGSGFQGKTAVHEVGHYLGLRHIWGDDNGACQGQAGYEDDGIADTPVQGDMSNFDCNKTRNSCNEGAGDLKDMVENYMDYSKESCQNSFTKGQIQLMESVLANQRLSVRVPLGIEETQDVSTNVLVYPNPIQEGNLNISIINLNYSQAEVSMFNSIGQLVKTVKLTNMNSNQSVDITNLPKGLYIVKTLIDGTIHNNQKLIIQ